MPPPSQGDTRLGDIKQQTCSRRILKAKQEGSGVSPDAGTKAEKDTGDVQVSGNRKWRTDEQALLEESRVREARELHLNRCRRPGAALCLRKEAEGGFVLRTPISGCRQTRRPPKIPSPSSIISLYVHSDVRRPLPFLT